MWPTLTKHVLTSAREPMQWVSAGFWICTCTTRLQHYPAPLPCIPIGLRAGPQRCAISPKYLVRIHSYPERSNMARELPNQASFNVHTEQHCNHPHDDGPTYRICNMYKSQGLYGVLGNKIGSQLIICHQLTVQAITSWQRPVQATSWSGSCSKNIIRVTAPLGPYNWYPHQLQVQGKLIRDISLGELLVSSCPESIYGLRVS